MNEQLNAPERWQARCKTHGLLVTAPRKAILTALLDQEHSCDAVALLQHARAHHPGVSMGTVYRFMRELEKLGLAQAQAQPHGRIRWRLRKSAELSDSLEVSQLLGQIEDFLHDLEQLGFAERQAAPSTETSENRTLRVLHQIAERLGYRLTPQHRESLTT
ncbi:transcriptional repressor [Dyella silvatica]|uniref:transcriptional repressor n=1 Tax=Dyella silvatica TaxID=2992128 RepID=UPI0022595D05|nr:transcriptional repressor [Dyella silvatica]